MNCLEYRRQLMTDPASRNPHLQEHAQACKSCAAFTEQLQSFETTLKSSADDIEIPEGLASRILLRQSTGIQQSVHSRRWMYAVAASLVLTVGLMFSVLQFQQSFLTADRLVLKHVYDEPHHLEDRKNVQLAQLNAVLKPLGRELQGTIGTVNYAGNCPMPKRLGAHLVLQGVHGPVTVLVMSEKKIDSRKEFSDEYFHGIVVPIENGSMAIVGKKGEVLTDIEQRLQPIKRYRM